MVDIGATMDDNAQQRDVRRCQCGCNLTFLVSPASRKVYFNRRHKENAKDLRRKLKGAQGEMEPCVLVSPVR